MSKKAIIEVQFNWIFIIIAGALILLFFGSVVVKQKSISDDRISATLITDLETILTGAEVSTGTINLVSIPAIDIYMECERYSVGRVATKIGNEIIFSPDLVKGGKLITWALDWNVPFWITNFLYITSPQVRYIIIRGSLGEADTIYELLPEEMNKELHIQGDAIYNENDYRVKFILVDTQPTADVLTPFSGMADNHVSAINIRLTDNQVEFFEKQGLFWQSKGLSSYLNNEALIGAIFSTDKESYDCSMNKAYEKLKIIAAIHQSRSEFLKSKYAGDCVRPHSEAVGLLQQIIAQDYSTPDALINLRNWANSLENQNGIAQLKSCVLIY